MAAETPSICAECEALVYPSRLSEHFFVHHSTTEPDDYRLKTWPDGTTVLLDFSFLRNLGQ